MQRELNFVNMVEEPCEGNPHARFREGKRISNRVRRIGEAELENELPTIYSAFYSTKWLM